MRMEDNEKPSKEYIKHFNAGYEMRSNYDSLTKDQRELFDHLSSLNSESERVTAFKDGIKECLLEKAFAPSRKNDSRDQAKAKDRDKNKDRGKDIDLDR